MTNEYRESAKQVYSELVRNGEYTAARKLLKAMFRGIEYLAIGLSDADWLISQYYGLAGAYRIRIK